MASVRFFKFLAMSGIAAVLNFSSRILLSHWMTYVPAIVLAYLVGMLTAFILNRLFVFTTYKNSLRNQVAWFTVINLVAISQTVVISVLFASYVLPAIGVRQHADMIAHAIGVLAPAISSYVGHKYLSFRPT